MNPRSIAVWGIGFGALAIATNGFLGVAEQVPIGSVDYAISVDYAEVRITPDWASVSIRGAYPEIRIVADCAAVETRIDSARVTIVESGGDPSITADRAEKRIVT